MFKKYIAKKAAKKSASWLAKREGKILVTAVATIATQKLLQKAGAKFPSLSFFKKTKTA